ncbi:kinetochore protein Spc25-like [Palaemon carinicauda]|uniref:kinetochore protein Spc25-like n=1 Tax=Palaemon carinicauda TaxID=392227 RepID=UPI0035B5CABE
MPVEAVQDYVAALENFDQKVSQNRKTLVKIYGDTLNQVTAACHHEQNVITKIAGEVEELQKKIASIREDVESVRTDKDRAGREKQKLQHEHEQLNLHINEKVHEKDELKELLSQREQKLREKEALVETQERNNQEKLANMEKGVLLYQTHLGLKIQRTRHNTLVFIFTQVNRLDPSQEYMLELTLENDKYSFVKSEPPLENLKELEERLNKSNNFSGCIVHIRYLFQKMED